ncbi:MAG TPA: hypothetical protein VEZ42_17230, partial [Pseudonocardia sp.]|nr:hypothetical protein [Pseudonocardia sp.]
VRFDRADDGTRVHVVVDSKPDGRSTVTVSHSRLPDADAAERTKAWWRERLATLEAQLEGGAVDA